MISFPNHLHFFHMVNPCDDAKRPWCAIAKQAVLLCQYQTALMCR